MVRVVSKSVWTECNESAMQTLVLHLVNSRLHSSEQFRSYEEYIEWISNIIIKFRG